jgi:hypothetical protein
MSEMRQAEKKQRIGRIMELTAAVWTIAPSDFRIGVELPRPGEGSLSR